MRRAFLRAAALAAMLFALGACGNGQSADPPESGVRGVVTAGPQCPVLQQGSPCPDRPWQGTVRATTPDGDVVEEVRTGAGGRFEIELEPGDYAVAAETEAGRLPTAAPEDVTVPEGGWAEVMLVVDTGIR